MVSNGLRAGAESLFAAAHRCLMADTPALKLAASHQVVAAWQAGELSLDEQTAPMIARIDRPGRPPLPALVSPRNLPHRGLGTSDGRAALLHAVAHIEFNAIDLAWDAAYRFRGMPRAFYDDWTQVAADEARHFGLLSERLSDYGYAYGDFDAHNGLWDMAIKTDGSCLERMALVPRVLEARGLDVTPAMIGRLRSVGDTASVAVLEIILREEVAHVAAGSRWFRWCCENEGIDAERTFDTLISRYASTAIKRPLNHDARRAAGFTENELRHLDGMAGA